MSILELLGGRAGISGDEDEESEMDWGDFEPPGPAVNTDCALCKAFTDLEEKHGVVSRIHFEFCSTDGHYAIHEEPKPANARGYVFCHSQDTQGAVESNGSLGLAYNGFGDVDSVEIGKTICSVLNEHGITTSWSGSETEKVTAHLSEYDVAHLRSLMTTSELKSMQSWEDIRQMAAARGLLSGAHAGGAAGADKPVGEGMPAQSKTAAKGKTAAKSKTAKGQSKGVQKPKAKAAAGKTRGKGKK